MNKNDTKGGLTVVFAFLAVCVGIQLTHNALLSHGSSIYEKTCKTTRNPKYDLWAGLDPDELDRNYMTRRGVTKKYGLTYLWEVQMYKATNEWVPISGSEWMKTVQCDEGKRPGGYKGKYKSRTYTYDDYYSFE